MKKTTILMVLLWLSVVSWLPAQGSFTTTGGASVNISGAAYLKLNNTHWNNSGTFTAGGSTVELSGSQVAGANIAGTSADVFHNLTVNRSGGNVVLGKDIAVNQALTFSAGLLDLNGYDITLNQPGGALSGENENSRIFSSSAGEAQQTLNLNAPNQANPGNLGAVITSASNLGATVIRRGHQPQTGICSSGMTRYFFIEPANNSGLNATLRFYYFDAELNGIAENDLHLYRSDNGGISWTYVGFDTRNTTDNWVEKTGIASFSLWALGCRLSLSGEILWEHNGTSGVQNAIVSLSGAGTGNDLTDIDGAYLISIPYAGGNFNLTPAKSINKLNGVTVADAVAIQQHIANTAPITSAYKQVAADVNKSNSITTLDATVINQSLLGNPSALAQFKTSWRFAPASHTMNIPPWGFPEKIMLTGVATDQTGQDFFGIKTGDIVATFANPANLTPAPPFVLRAEDLLLESGSEISVEFKAGQTNDLSAWQFALHFDPAQLQLAEIQPLAALPLTADHFGTFNIAEGEIRSVWSQAEGVFLEEAAPVFSLKFNVLQGGDKLSEALSLNEDALPGYAYNNALAELKVELNYYELTESNEATAAAGLQLLQNRPNPFAGTTTISFVIPQESEAQLRIFDVSGRMLSERKGQYAAGRHEELFDLGGISGVLCYELTTPFGVLTKKMVAY